MRERGRESPTHWFTPQRPTTAGLGQVEPAAGTPSGSPTQVGGAQAPKPPPAASWVYSQQVEAEPDPRHGAVGGGHPRWQFNPAVPPCPPADKCEPDTKPPAPLSSRGPELMGSWYFTKGTEAARGTTFRVM